METMTSTTGPQVRTDGARLQRDIPITPYGDLSSLETIPEHNFPIVEESIDRVTQQLDYWLKHRYELGRSFVAFTDELVPQLARMAVENPEVVDLDFDLHLDDHRLRASGDGIDPAVLQWIEERVNGNPRLVALAESFNERVVETYGTPDQPFHQWESRTLPQYQPIADLADTVDSKVGFMSLVRRARDADLKYEPFIDESNRYEVAAAKVFELIVDPTTYDVGLSGDVLLDRPKPPSAEWVA